MALPLPQFTAGGVLPPGDYSLTFEELRVSMLVTGPADCPNWDSAWRAKLVDNLEIMVNQLWKVGVDRIFINGSFVEDRDHPNDIDGYFECDREKLGDLVMRLNLIDPHKVWTWEFQTRRAYRGYPKRQLPMWHHYRVELYPQYPGHSSGMTDQYGNAIPFPSLFRICRYDGGPKGIIQIVRQS